MFCLKRRAPGTVDLGFERKGIFMAARYMRALVLVCATGMGWLAACGSSNDTNLGSGGKGGSGGSAAKDGGAGDSSTTGGKGGTGTGGTGTGGTATGGTGTGGVAGTGTGGATGNCGLCPQNRPVCDPATNLCVECVSNPDCAGN